MDNLRPDSSDIAVFVARLVRVILFFLCILGAILFAPHSISFELSCKSFPTVPALRAARYVDEAKTTSIDTTITAVRETKLDLRFAVFGDYGDGGPTAGDVAKLVKSFHPDLIVTTGDNGYGPGPVDYNVGQFYSDYIGNYVGSYGSGSVPNRFFPSIGNHDYTDGGGIAAYLNYFTLPDSGTLDNNTSGNERYYDFVTGPVHFYMVNSCTQEPDGRTSTSIQAKWLQAQLAASASPWNVVCLHHPPYCSGSRHGSDIDLQWPFEDWGADVVFAGHEHLYERLLRDDNGDEEEMPYIVSGNGGYSLYDFGPPIQGSQVRYNQDFGTSLVDASNQRLAFYHYSIDSTHGINGLIDSYTIHKPQAIFEVNVGTVGNGSVSKTPDRTGYLAGDTVVVTAVPDLGWHFAGWSGGLDGTDNPDTLVVVSDTTVTATFVAREFTVNTGVTGNGTIARSPEKAAYFYGETVVVVAVPDSAWVFVEWSGGLTGNDNPDTIVVERDTTVTASFVETGKHDPAPPRTALYQNKPNPFNSTTVIEFTLDKDSHVVLSIHDVAGNEIRRLVDRKLVAGPHDALWDGRDHLGNHVATGVYIYRLRTPQKTFTKKAVLLK